MKHTDGIEIEIGMRIGGGEGDIDLGSWGWEEEANGRPVFRIGLSWGRGGGREGGNTIPQNI